MSNAFLLLKASVPSVGKNFNYAYILRHNSAAEFPASGVFTRKPKIGLIIGYQPQ